MSLVNQTDVVGNTIQTTARAVFAVRMSAASPHRPEVHEFAEHVYEKCNRRQRRKGGLYDYTWPEAVRDMVRDLLTKEGWRRGPSGSVGNPTP